MKKLTKEELVDGFELQHIEIQFSGKGMETEITVEKVRKSSHITPAEGCDMITNKGSTYSENIYEIGGTEAFRDFNTFEFCLKSYGKVTVSCNCLLENVPLVHGILRGLVLDYAKKVSDSLALDAKNIKTIIRKQEKNS